MGSLFGCHLPLSSETVCVDGASHPVRQPEDVLTLERFQNLTINLAE